MPVHFTIPEPHIGLLTIARPEVLNALNWAAMDGFSAVVLEALARPDLRALIITGAGQRAFCAGGDLGELHQSTSYEDGIALSRVMTNALQHLEDAPFPTIAAMNGLARGGGMEIALACDLRVLSETADMGMTQVRLGLTPGWGSGQRLLRLVGYSLALEWLTTGRVLIAHEALSYGIVNHVVPSEQVIPASLGLARKICQQPPDAVAEIKKLLLSGVQDDTRTAAQVEQNTFPPLWVSKEHQARSTAFFDRKQKDS